MSSAHRPEPAESVKHLLLDQVSDAVLLNRISRIDYANAALLHLLGAVRPEQILGRSPLDFIHPDYQALTRSRMQRLMQRGGQMPPVDIALVRLDGQAVAVELKTAAYSDALGPAIAFFMRERAARASGDTVYRQQAQLIELSFEPILMWDWECGILTWNQGCEQLYGHARQDALGQDSHRLLETRFPESQAAFEAALLRDGQWTGELRHRTRAGRAVIVESRMRLLRQGDRRVVLEANRDITERKRAEDSLRRQMERYDLVVAGAGDAIWDWDICNRRVHFSTRWKALRGYPHDAEIDSEETWSASIHPDDAPRVMAAVQAHFEGKTDDFQAEYRIRCQDGSWKWIHARGIAQRDTSGRVVRMAGSERDITEQRQTEAQLAAVLDAQRAISTADDDYSGLLRRILESLSQLTGADGASLERVEGDAMVYEAATGMANGFVGLRLKTTQSLSGLALTSGQPQGADDTETDPRVDRAACRRIGVRSMIMIPLRYSAGWFGVLKLMSSRTGAFDGAAAQTLRLMAEFLGATIARQRVQDDLKINQAALQEAHERFVVALQAAPVVVFTQDQELRYTWVENPALGFRPEEVVGRTEQDLFERAEDADHLIAIKQRVLETGEPAHEEAAIFSKGVQRWFDLNVQARRENGRIVGLIATAIDVTERKHQEERLRTSEARYRNLVEQSVDGIFLADAEGHYLDVNSAGAQMLGYTPEEICTLAIADIILPEEAERLPGEIAELATGAVVSNEWQFRRKDGSTFRGEVLGRQLPDGRLLGILRDITVHKQREQVLRDNAQRLRLATEATGVGIWEWNVQTNAIRWDAQMFRIYGLAPTPEGMVDYTAWASCVLPEDLAAQERVLQETAHVGGQSNREFRIRRVADGECRFIQAAETVRRNSRGEVEWVVGTNLDVTARRSMEESLRQRAEELEQVLDAVPAAVWVSYDPLCRSITGNRFANHVYETAPGDNVSASTLPDVRRFFAPDGRELAADELPMQRACASNKAVRDVELRVVMPSMNSDLTLLGSAVPLRDAEGHVRGSIGTFMDITARKQAETALHESELRWRLAQAAARIGIWDWNLQTGESTFNTEYFDLYGLPAGTAQTFADFLVVVHPEDRRLLDAALRAAISRQQPLDVEFRIRRGDTGAERWVASKGNVAFDAQGHALRAMGATYDITDRKQAETALAAQKALLDAIIDNIPVMLCIWDAELKRFRFNAHMRDVLGWTEADVAGGDFLEKCYPDPVERAAVIQYMRSLESGWQDMRSTAKDGSVVETSWANIRLDDGTLIGIGLDIRTRKAAEAALHAADRRKDEFLAMLAHELRNPLAPIRNSLYILQKTGGQMPQAERLLAMIQRQVDHLTRMVDDLLDVSRITRGKIKLKKEIRSLAELMQDAIEISRPLIEAQRHSLAVTEPPDHWTVEGDPVRIAQVFSNLLNNAAKYTPPGGRIELRAARDAQDAVVVIRDTGIGIPADLLPQVFDLFTQAERGLDRAQGGLGIGLALVRNLVELHGGRVTADSEGPGRGSEFRVYLPLMASVSPASLD